MNKNKIDFKTPHTRVGHAFEAVAALLAIALWVLIAVVIVRVYHGEMNRQLVILGVTATLISAAMMVGCYHPQTFNIPVKHPQAGHYLLVIEDLRLTSILLMLTYLSQVVAYLTPVGDTLFLVTAVALLLVNVVYLIRIWRLKPA